MDNPMPLLFDRALLKRRRQRALAAARPDADILARLAADDLADRLMTISRQFETAVLIGSPSGYAAERLQATGRINRLIRADLFIAGAADDHPADLVIDDEALPFAGQGLDLVISLLTLQWANDLPGALIQVRRALRPDGLFLASLIGGQSLAELRTALAAAEAETIGGASPRISPFADVRDLGGLLQRAGFALPVTDEDRFTLRYASALGLMRDLRAMGATNILVERPRQPMPRALLLRAAELYAAENAGGDGRVSARFSLLSMSGWAPHPRQQKPLAPGSARHRLADALGTREHRLPRESGERPGRKGGPKPA